MRNKELFITIAILLLAVLLGYAWLTPAGSKRAPELLLQTSGGHGIAIGGDTGKPVLINFWATTCTSCLQEIPHLISLYEKLHPQGLQIIGVSMSYDPPVQVMDMIKRKQIPYPIVFDLDKKIQHAFGMQQAITPTTVLIDGQGTIVLQKQGMPDMDKLQQQINAMLSAPSHTN